MKRTLILSSAALILITLSLVYFLRLRPAQIEIEQKVAGFKEELFNLRFQLATGQLDNPTRIRDVRKEIARAKTVLRERELGITS